MAILLRNSLEYAPAGTTIPMTGATAADGSTFSYGTEGAGATFVSDSSVAAAIAVGTYAGKIALPATAVSSFRGWSHASATTLHYRTYIYLAAYPNATLDLIHMLSGGTIIGRLRMTTTGQLRGANNNTDYEATSGVIPLNTLVRIEVTATFGLSGAGALSFDAYSGQSTAPLAGLSGNLTGLTFLVNTSTRTYFGIPAAGPTNFTMWTDGWGLSDTARLGPATLPPGWAYFLAVPGGVTSARMTVA